MTSWRRLQEMNRLQEYRKEQSKIKTERLARFIWNTGRGKTAEYILSDNFGHRGGKDTVHFVACKADMTPFQGACVTACRINCYMDGKPLSSRPWTPKLSEVTCGNCKAILRKAAKMVVSKIEKQK
mgnify:CR=1 FL=1